MPSRLLCALLLPFLMSGCSGPSSETRTGAAGDQSSHPTLDDYLAGRYTKLLSRCQGLLKNASTDSDVAEIKVCITVLPAIAVLKGDKETAKSSMREGCKLTDNPADYVAMVSRLYVMRAVPESGEKEAMEGLSFIVDSGTEVCGVSSDEVLAAVKRHSEMLK